MNKITLILLLMTSFCFGQTLTLGSGSSITISSNGSLILSGLELDPSENYTISGPNVISRSSIPIEIGGKSSIDRVYEFSAELSDYSGVLSFSYLDDEIYNIVESDLVLEILDTSGDWTSFFPFIEEDDNILSYNFTDLDGFIKVTASDSTSLNIFTETLNGTFRIYPNPSSDMVYIEGNYTQLNAVVYDILGKKVINKSFTKSIDIRHLDNGVYILQLSDGVKLTTQRIIKN